MFKTKPKTAYVLSVIIALLAVAASVGGIAIADLYRDNDLIASAFFGNDWATLVAAVPLLGGALILSARGSLRAQMVWLGMLLYMAYNFAFYLFGAAFNSLFLVYTALFAIAIFTLIILLRALDIKVIREQFKTSVFIKWISVYMLFVGLFLGGLHISLSLSYIFTGDVPELILMLDHPTSLISALDLSVIVPLHLLGAIWLWQRRPWGYALAIIVNVQGAVYNLALVISVVSEFQAGTVDTLSEVPQWGSIAIVSLAISIFLLGRLEPETVKALYV